MEHPVNMNMGRPKIAIVDANTLVVLGLKQLLQNVMPIMTVDSFSSFQGVRKGTAKFVLSLFCVTSNCLRK